MNISLICIISFVLTLIIFLISLKLNTLKEMPTSVKYTLLFCSLIPVCGISVAIIIFIIKDLYFKNKS